MQSAVDEPLARSIGDSADLMCESSRTSPSADSWASFGAPALFVAVPAWRTAVITDGADNFLSTAVVFAAVAWYVWQYRLPAAPSRHAIVAAVTALALIAWQLAWVGTEGRWFLPFALVGWTMAAAALCGGNASLWRAVAAVLCWCAWLIGSAPAALASFAEWVAAKTALTAGWLLWQAGANVRVAGTVLHSPEHRIEVLPPCTGLPLASLLLVLLLIAALLLPLRKRALLTIGPTILAGAFLIGAARVIVLTLAAGDDSWFAYWHGAGGSGWFSALGVMLLIGLVTAALRKAQVPAMERSSAPATGPTPSTRRLPAGSTSAAIAICAGTASCFAVGLLTRAPSADNEVTAPAIASFNLQSVNQLADGTPGAVAPDSFALLQQATYRRGSDVVQIDVSFATVPRLLTGDPRIIAELHGRAPAAVEWTRRNIADGEVWQAVGDGHVVWFAIVTEDGRAFSTHDAWLRHSRTGFTELRGAWDWVTHQRRLPVKAAAWICVTVNSGPTTEASDVLARACRAWQQHARQVIGEINRRALSPP